MGRSFSWITKERIKHFYGDMVLQATNSSAMFPPPFSSLAERVQSGFDRRTYIVYDKQGYWYELDRRLPC